ncbi:hypothetical protein DFS34DRAFT_334711 [Phlyctochytrium arcticum]|nr:hypothetical protein DFS34DRAFT_334711 [Phlyctochytrium arcticum]
MDPFTKTCSFVLPLLLLAGINPQSAFAQQGVPSSSSPQPSSVTSTLSSSPPQPTTAPAPTIPNNQLIVPWRDHHAGFAGENGVYFSGGRVDPRQAPFSLGGPTIALNRQRAMWQSSNSTYFISAQNLTASISNLSLPALFGHSCAVDAASQIAYCSGGFDSEANPPYEASSSIFRYNLRTGDVQQADMPFSRGFHTSAIVNGSLYLFGGVDCSYCSNRVGYNFTRTTRFNLVDSTVSALLDINTPSAPSDIIGSCSVPIDGNKVLLIGGARTQPSNSAIPDLVWQFDPSNPTTLFAPLRNITGAGPDPRWGVACAKHPKSNLVYVQGGCDPRGGEPVDGKMYVLDATKMAWTTVGGTAGPGPRCFAAGVILNDFFVVHGGRRGPFGTVNSTTSAAGPSSGSSTSLRAPQSTGTAIPPVAAPQPTTSGSSPTPQAGGQQEQAPDTEDASRDDAWADRFIPGGMSSFSPNQAGYDSSFPSSLTAKSLILFPLVPQDYVPVRSRFGSPYGVPTKIRHTGGHIKPRAPTIGHMCHCTVDRRQVLNQAEYRALTMAQSMCLT